MKIEFRVPGKAQGKARARTFYNPRMSKTQTITPENTVLYENWVKTCFNASKPKNFLIMAGPIYMEIIAVYKKAKSSKLSTPMLKPDIDNICKIIADSLNGMAYLDDKQIIAIKANKIYGELGEVRVRIEEIEPMRFEELGDI